jgi:hypothetical protein
LASVLPWDRIEHGSLVGDRFYRPDA